MISKFQTHDSKNHRVADTAKSVATIPGLLYLRVSWYLEGLPALYHSTFCNGNIKNNCLLVCLYAVFDSPDKASRRSEGTAWGRTALFNMGSTLFEDLAVSKVPDPIPAGRREWVEGEFQSHETRNSVHLNSSVFIDSGQMDMNTFILVI